MTLALYSRDWNFRKLRIQNPGAKEVILGSHCCAAARRGKPENQYTHSGQFTTRASLSAAICQSQSLEWDGTH